MKTLSLILAAALPGAAGALTLDLFPAQQTATVGATVSFFGRVVNDGPDTLALTGNGFTAVSGDFSGFTVGDLAASVPFSLDAGEAYEGLVFEVAIPATAMSGLRLGRYAIFGDDGTPNAVVGEGAFGIEAVPEPASTLALAAGMGGFLARRRRVRD